MHWIVFMASLYMYYAPCFVLIEHSMFYETMSVLIDVFIILSYCLLSTLLVLTLTVRELRHQSFIASMSPQIHFGDEEDGHIGLPSWLHFICIMLLALLCWLSTLCVLLYIYICRYIIYIYIYIYIYQNTKL